MEEISSEVDELPRPRTFLGELRSVAFSGIGIVFDMRAYLQDEIALASWRRVTATILLNIIIQFVIVVIGLSIYQLTVGFPFKNVAYRLWQNLVWYFTGGMVSQALIWLIAAYLSCRWLISRGAEAKQVVHAQSMMILLLPYILVLSFLDLANQILSFLASTYRIETQLAGMLQFDLSGSGAIAAVFFYWMVARMLFLLYPSQTRRTRLIALGIIVIVHFSPVLPARIGAIMSAIRATLPPG